MVTASNAWELADATGGRFRLGIGPQVRAHVERRYSSAFAHPGPRMKEYVESLKAIFRAYRGEAKLDYHGEFYDFSLLPQMWNPGPIAVPDPPVDVAAVNPWMLRMAGEVADGVHVHPLNTPTYVRETVVPNVETGAAEAGRTRDEVALIVPCFTVSGDTEDERAVWRERSRTQVAFYGSTPNYGFIFEQVGFPGTTDRIRAAQKAGDIPGMGACIPDDLLAHFVVEGSWDELPGRIVDRYGGIADRVVLYHATAGIYEGPEVFAKFGRVARQVVAATTP
jgi:probable F420-dependent oxidoreductase